MAVSFEDRKNYLVPKEYFIGKLRSISGAGLNLTLNSEKQFADGARFCITHGATLKSRGENITVTLTYLESGTGVNVISECSMASQTLDFGKNKNNVAAIFKYLESDIKNIPE